MTTDTDTDLEVVLGKQDLVELLLERGDLCGRVIGRHLLRVHVDRARGVGNLCVGRSRWSLMVKAP